MKNFYFPLALAIATAPMFHVAMAAADYAKGVIIINENNYGEAGTLNHLQPDLRTGYFTYRIFQKENPGRTLGQTSCFGAYDNLLYVVSKQSKAQNATTAGGILTAIEPTTMKWQWQLDQLDPSGKRAEGRGFLGVTPDKAYVSSSNGIWVIDLATHTSKGMIEGTQNPNGVDDKPASDGTSTIYHGQCGTMVAAAGRVFAAHQIFGLLVIDPTTDTLERTISLDFVADGAAIGSIVADKEGYLWLSVAKSSDTFAPSLSVLVRVNPSTLETSVYNLPEGVYGPATTWDSWKPDSFCASSTEPYLFWTGAEQSFYAGPIVYRFDTTTGHARAIIDFNLETDVDIPWQIYGCSMRVNPADGTLFTSVYQDFSSTTYAVRTFKSDGTSLRTYPMEKAYWFPGMMLFPESELAGVENVVWEASGSLGVLIGGRSVELTGIHAGVTAEVFSISGAKIASARADADGHAKFDMDFAPGIYIAAAGSQKAKFAVR